MASERFHHGNLRAALIELATEELTKRGHEELSLRHLALRLGVSSAALYRHFTNKDDLLRTIAENGLLDLVAVYEAAVAMDAPPKARLCAACRGYLALAVRNPGLFNLLFFTDAYIGRFRQPLLPERPSGFALFESLVARARGVTGTHRIRPIALACWSAIHGLAILTLHGRIRGPDEIQRVEAEVMAMVCGGRHGARRQTRQAPVREQITRDQEITADAL